MYTGILAEENDGQRIYNVEKGRKRNTFQSEATHQRSVVSLKRFTQFLDHATQQYSIPMMQMPMKTKRHSSEMENNKPRKDIVLPLMNKLFYNCRQYLLKST